MRITLAAVPAYGHVLPLVPLALDAARAGHEVTFAASNEFSGGVPVDEIENVPRGWPCTTPSRRRSARSRPE